MAVPLENFRVDMPNEEGFTLPRLQLRDRRAAGHPQLHWVYQRHLESILYNRASDGGTTGAIWKILNATGLGSTALHVNGSAIALGQVTQPEYDEMMARFKLSLSGVDPSSVGRIRSFTLLPVTTAAAVARSFGCSPTSLSFLRSLAQPVPQAWELQEQAEDDAANGEVDLVLQEQLESAQNLEIEEVESFTAELQQMAPFAASAEEEGRMKAYAMANPPAMLTSELKAYVSARTSVFDARRSGSAVVSTTVEGETQSILRFFGFLQRTNRVPDGAFLYVSEFLVRADLGDLVQTYAEWLRQNQQLRFGSIANYLNGIAAMTAWAYRTFTIPADTAALDPSPLAQIYNLRGQAEGQSKTEQMFDKRVGGWIDWSDVQKARVEAITRSNAKRGDSKLLRDAAAISLLSLIPPDRVGLIRKLRLGHTLKKAAGGGWRLDLTKQRDGHKTSKFYGPFAAKLPSELDAVLDAYASVLEMSSLGGTEAYLFHPATGRPDRALESSAWTQYVRRLFERLTGTAIAPKTLRSIFITWLRETTDCPEVLKSAAHAMKHQTATQASAHYDANADTKLVKAAYEFNLSYAAKFGGGGSSSGAGGSGADEVEVTAEFKVVDPQASHYVFRLAPADAQPAGDADYRVFRVEMPWDPTFSPGCSLRFPVVPGFADGATWKLPADPSTVGSNLCFSAKVSKQAARGSSFTVRNLMVKEPDGDDQEGSIEGTEPAAEEGEGGSEEEGEEERGEGEEWEEGAEEEEEGGEEQGREEVVGGEWGGEDGADMAGEIQEMEINADAEEEAPDPPAEQDLRRSARKAKAPRLSYPPASAGTGVSAREVDNAAAFDVSGVEVGMALLAKGFAPSGQKEWFRAEVTALRPSFPPIVVKFTATEGGATLPLALPRPRTAYVMKVDTKPLP